MPWEALFLNNSHAILKLIMRGLRGMPCFIISALMLPDSSLNASKPKFMLFSCEDYAGSPYQDRRAWGCSIMRGLWIHPKPTFVRRHEWFVLFFMQGLREIDSATPPSLSTICIHIYMQRRYFTGGLCPPDPPVPVGPPLSLLIGPLCPGVPCLCALGSLSFVSWGLSPLCPGVSLLCALGSLLGWQWMPKHAKEAKESNISYKNTSFVETWVSFAKLWFGRHFGKS